VDNAQKLWEMLRVSSGKDCGFCGVCRYIENTERKWCHLFDKDCTEKRCRQCVDMFGV